MLYLLQKIDYKGPGIFDILINNIKIATGNIANKKPGEFYNATYEIPEQLLAGKKQLTVKFVPHEGHRGGPVFGIRTVKK